MSDVSEPAVASEYILGVYDFDLRWWRVDELGWPSPTDTVISCSDRVSDIELLLRTCALIPADEPGRLSKDRRE